VKSARACSACSPLRRMKLGSLLGEGLAESGEAGLRRSSGWPWSQRPPPTCLECGPVAMARRGCSMALELGRCEPPNQAADGCDPHRSEHRPRSRSSKRAVLYDKQGDAHFRSDQRLHQVGRAPTRRALFWLARMVEAGRESTLHFFAGC